MCIRDSVSLKLILALCGNQSLRRISTRQEKIKRSINSSKRLKWESLRRDLDSDPTSLGQRLVMRKHRARVRSLMMDEQQMRFIVNSLFPPHPLRDREQYPGLLEEVPLLSENEVSQTL